MALPDRHVEPHFQHHADLPRVTGGGGVTATVILGELDGALSPGATYTPFVDADLAPAPDTGARLPLDPDFEYAVLAMPGEVHVAGVPVLPSSMPRLRPH